MTRLAPIHAEGWLPAGENADFARAYPGEAAAVVHRLQHHPLFALEALAELAGRLPESHVEHSRGDLRVDQDPAAIRQEALSPAEIVRTIATNRCWMVLKKVDADPAYAALIDQCLAEIAGVVEPATGPYLRREAFVFISAPHSVTPFHMDPEHNILLQIAGQKTMRVYPAGDDRIVPQEIHEAFHRGGRHRNMKHLPEFDRHARDFAMAAGDAVYVPVKAPHWVQNGAEPSISFSITWRSRLSDAEARVHRVNAGLRKVGLMPGTVGEAPAVDAVKVALHKAGKTATGVVKRVIGKGRDRSAY
jgi:hypothetical protein